MCLTMAADVISLDMVRLLSSGAESSFPPRGRVLTVREHDYLFLLCVTSALPQTTHPTVRAPPSALGAFPPNTVSVNICGVLMMTFRDSNIFKRINLEFSLSHYILQSVFYFFIEFGGNRAAEKR